MQDDRDSCLDLDSLRSQLQDATREAIQCLAAESLGKTVYGFALCACWDGFDCEFDFFPSASTEEHYTAALSEDTRWSPYDWEYERLGAESYATVRKFVTCAYEKELQSKQDVEHTTMFHGDVVSQMVLALYNLRSEGAFSAFPSATVICSEVESDGWLERFSARALNSHTLDVLFLQEFEPIDLAFEERQSAFRRFRKRLVQTGEFPDIWQEHK